MSRTLQPGDEISHYRIVGPLGAGGMGEVYIAQDTSLERSVALKVLPLSLVRNEERVRRFVTEAKSASSLNHPNIVTIYEIGKEEPRPRPEVAPAGDDTGPGTNGGETSSPVHFISMELISGETLAQKIHHEKSDLKTLLGWLAQAAEGVAKAHAAGIVHRDLKPGNIMVSKDGFTKVLDFGLAKLTEKQPVSSAEMTSAPTEMGARTGEGTIMGTVGYMSPEQVQGKAVDHRSDVFSMGCILYEASTRRRPFVADTDVEVMHQILRDKPSPIEEVNPEAPAELRRLVRRCLAKSPDQRLQSMKDLAIELREIVDDYDALSATATSATSAGSVPSGVLGTVPGRRTGLLVLVGAAVALGLAGAGVGLYSMLGRGSGPGESGLLDMKMSVLMSRENLNEAVLSADGRYLAYVTTSDRLTSLVVRQVRTGVDVVILPDNEFQMRGIRFSPDGDYLHYLNRDPDNPGYSALFEVASLGGAPRKLLFDVDSAANFSPDGKRLCFRRGVPREQADTLVVADVGTWKEKELIRVRGPEQFTGSPSWSPDGSTIAIGLQNIAGGVKTWLVAIDSETGEKERITARTWLSISDAAWAPDGSAVYISAFDLGTGTGSQIYRISHPGGADRRLTNDLEDYSGISLSADGRTLATIRESTVNNLWVAPIEEGLEAEPITFAAGTAESIGAAVPLPGRAVAFTAPRGNKVYLWRMDADGSGRRQLNSEGSLVFNPAYAPGAGIVFNQVTEGENLIPHIWRVRPDGSDLEQITDGDGEQITAVSPAGNAIAFVRWSDTRSLWTLELDGGDPVKIVDGGPAGEALFSPDGTRVLVTKREDVDGRNFPRRYIMPPKGGEPLASFLLPPGAADIEWAPDGKSLTYVDRNLGWNLMRKPLPDGEPERLTRFEDGQIPDYNWHPDGSRLVIHRRVNLKDSLWDLKPGEKEPVLVTEFKTGVIPVHRWAPDEPLLYFTYGTSSRDVVMITDFR